MAMRLTSMLMFTGNNWLNKFSMILLLRNSEAWKDVFVVVSDLLKCNEGPSDDKKARRSYMRKFEFMKRLKRQAYCLSHAAYKVAPPPPFRQSNWPRTVAMAEIEAENIFGLIVQC